MILLSDRRSALRAFALSALIFAISLGISAASDEGGVAWLDRVTRVLPLAPMCAALAAWLSLASARAKADALALEATGRSPKWNAAGAVAGSAGFALLTALMLASWTKLDVVSIFPSFASAPRIEWDGTAFIDKSHGVSIDEKGETSPHPKEESTTPTPSERRERIAASLALALAGIAFPLISAAFVRRVSSRGVAVVAAVALATILAFDAVASGRAPPIVVTLPPLALTVYAFVEYLRSAWFVPSR